MDLLNDIFEFVSGGGHSGSGSGSGSAIGNGNGSGGYGTGAVIVSDMGINEIGSEYYGNEQRTGYRCFDIHRDVSFVLSNEGESIAETKNIQISSNLDAFSIRQSTASPDISTPAPTFYSRPLVTGGQQGNNMVDSFHIYADSSMSHANNRFSTIPKTPDLVSHIHFQKEHTTLSMNTMISQVNIFGSNPQFYQGYNDPQRPKGSMMILREGWKRKYRVDIARYRDDGPGPMTQVFYWKGPMSPRAIFGSNNHNRTTSLGSSSTELKLVSADHPTQVLAVWKGGDGDGQQGNLTIFEGVGFAEGGILTEIITSCLVVTLFERNSLFGILDWLTK
jgi:hypothetical protein